MWTGKQYSESRESKISYPGELSLVSQERVTFHDSGTNGFLYAKIYTVLLRRKYVGNINDILEVANHCQGKLESHSVYTQACTGLHFKGTRNLEWHTCITEAYVRVQLKNKGNK